MRPRSSIRNIKWSLKIAFVHNYYIHYRVPLFKMLSRIFDVRFFFDDIHKYMKNVSSDLNYVINPGPKIKGVKFPILLWFHLLKYKPDIIVAGDATYPSTIIAFIISKLLRKTFVLWEERWFWPSSIIASLLWPIARIIALKSNALIVPGIKSKEFYESIGVTKERIFIAPNASYVYTSNEHKIKAEVLLRKFNLNNKVTILYIGRVVPYKGVHLILEALLKLRNQRIHNIHLLIVGECDLSYKELLDKYITINNLNNVNIIGFVEEEEKGVYYELADIVVYPSYYEVWGMVVNEAMYAGKPIVSTTTCAAACDLLREYPDLLISPGDVDKLVKSLKSLITDARLRESIGTKLKLLVNEKYSYKQMLKGFIKAIRYALSIRSLSC